MMTGLHRPSREILSRLVRPRKPQACFFADDGETPNNPKWPLLIYRSAVDLRSDLDPAGIFEDLFALHDWTDSWRNGVYDFLHFHTHRHEVLGIARGNVEIAFGGARGTHLCLKAGDVAILPAGTGHRRIAASEDLLVVGAYPQNSGAYDQPKPADKDHHAFMSNIIKVPRPDADPVYGPHGPAVMCWR